MKKLEAYKAFPIIAWFLVLGFAYYVYYLSTDLETESNVLSEQTEQTVEAQANPNSI